MTVDKVHVLRALAVLELELDQLVAHKVAAAKKAGLSWDEIAQASGVSRPSVWRRWKDGVDDPRPTRPARRDASRLLLTGAAAAVVHRLTDELATRAVGRKDDHPWSGAVRVALNRLSKTYEVTQRGAREIEFRLHGTRIQVTCLEPGSDGPGGLSVLIAPRPELTLSGKGTVRTAGLTSDVLIPVAGEELIDSVLTFLRQQIEADAESA
ncbi:helix-turn-helix domain-containing protein [Pseudonocardia adelaidensis]|uniref:Helix-turn-helix domain-containing protein n=1 Tax=Pseudonocardia adelaidensis TaxID=648754 RepID=A0ABP9NTF8_9PSEU